MTLTLGGTSRALLSGARRLTTIWGWTMANPMGMVG
jgi:hypothetical protein